MKIKYSVLFLIILLVVSFSFTGCVKVVSPQKAAAVEQTVKSLSTSSAVQDLPTEQEKSVVTWLMDHAKVDNPLKQIREQAKGQKGDVLDFDIVVRIPVLTNVQLSDIQYSLPVANLDNPDPKVYTDEITSAVADGVYSYIQNADVLNAVDFTIHCTMQPEEKGYTAIFDDSDLSDVISTLCAPMQDFVQSALDSSDLGKITFLHDTQELIQSISSDAGTDWQGSFFKQMKVNLTSQGTDSYLLTVTMPDQDKVLAAASQALTTAYTQQYPQGTLVPFTTDSVEADFQQQVIQALPATTDTVSKEYTGTQQDIADMASTFAITMSDGLNTAYQQALAAEVDSLNTSILKQPVEQPQTGVLSGASEGQSITVDTKAGEGAHYLKFELLPGADLSVDGQTQLTVYIADGASTTVRLPSGNYKLKYASGTAWYGEQDLFGPDGSYQVLDSVLAVENGHAYTLSLYNVEGGTIGSDTINKGDF